MNDISSLFGSSKLLLGLTILRVVATLVCLLTAIVTFATMVHSSSSNPEQDHLVSIPVNSQHADLRKRNASLDIEIVPSINISSTSHPTITIPPFLNGTSPNPGTSLSFNKQQESSAYVFFLHLTLVLLGLKALLTLLKDWPRVRPWLCADFELSDKEAGGLMDELRRSYSWIAIGSSLILNGSIIFALNLGSNPGWRLASWQLSLLDVSGYASVIVGMIYVVLGLGAPDYRRLRDHSQTSVSQTRRGVSEPL